MRLVKARANTVYLVTFMKKSMRKVRLKKSTKNMKVKALELKCVSVE